MKDCYRKLAICSILFARTMREEQQESIPLFAIIVLEWRGSRACELAW
jgi:hypothetical protein